MTDQATNERPASLADLPEVKAALDEAGFSEVEFQGLTEFAQEIAERKRAELSLKACADIPLDELEVGVVSLIEAGSVEVKLQAIAQRLSTQLGRRIQTDDVVGAFDEFVSGSIQGLRAGMNELLREIRRRN